MILIVTSAPHRYTHESVEAERGEIGVRVVAYGELIADRKKLPAATYVFTDFERLPAWRVAEAAQLYRMLRKRGCRVINDPARVSSRYGLLRLLHRSGINDFNAYRIEELVPPSQWPV
ncbi:MAG: hypothetical protein ACM3YM_05720, partial [Sphingomonadales bacterium]